MLIIFIFSTVKAYGVDNKYERIIKESLEKAEVPDNFIDECKAEIIDTSKLLVDGKFNEKPSSVIKNFIKREHGNSCDDYDFKKEIDEFKKGGIYSQLITAYNISKTFPNNLKLAIVFLIYKLEELEKEPVDFKAQLIKTYTVLRLLEYESKLLKELQNIDNIKTTPINTPSGKKIVIGGRSSDEYNEPYSLIIDFGGNDKYIGPVASSVKKDEVSIVLDLAGDDLYENKVEKRGSQGSAEKGIAVLFDLSGDDVYKSISKSQGSGLIGGIGVLWDKSGKDRYYSSYESQGFGGGITEVNDDGLPILNYYGGLGLLLDTDGDDIYKVDNSFGQPSPQLAGIRQNFSQGAASNIDGFGMLIDLQGNDEYDAYTFAQGMGIFCGKGSLFDKKGNDLYSGMQYAQGAAAHGGIGVLIDNSGDDYYYITESQGLGSGKDFVKLDLEYNPLETSVAIFLDESGNDEYYFKRDSCGVGINDGIGYFIDMNGADVYKNSGMGNGKLINDKDGKIYTGERLTLGMFYDHEGDDSYPKEAKITNNIFYIRPPVDNSNGGSTLGYQLGLSVDK